jgi:hypothetical protein
MGLLVRRPKREALCPVTALCDAQLKGILLVIKYKKANFGNFCQWIWLIIGDNWLWLIIFGHMTELAVL